MNTGVFDVLVSMNEGLLKVFLTDRIGSTDLNNSSLTISAMNDASCLVSKDSSKCTRHVFPR